jgi:hypothetical protein
VSALVLLGGVVAYSAVASDRLPELSAGVAAVGWTVVALGLLGRWPSLLSLGLACAGAGYAVLLGLRSASVDPRAPIVAAALFVAAELGFWSLEPLDSRAERIVGLRRLLFIAAAGLGAALIGSLLLVAAAEGSGGIALEAVGVLAAVLTLGIVALLAARSRLEASARR